MTARSENLTARQQEILDFIRSTVESEGRPPTRAEVCTAFGFRSVWVNRNGLPEEYNAFRPAAVLPSLEGLLALG